MTDFLKNLLFRGDTDKYGMAEKLKPTDKEDSMTKMGKGRFAVLVAAALLCSLVLAMALGAFAARVGSFEDADRKLEAIKSAQGADNVKEAILDLRAYLDRNPLNESDERYAPFMKEYGYRQYEYVRTVMGLFEAALGDADAMKTYYNDMCTVMSDPGLVIERALVDEVTQENEILRAEYDEFLEKFEAAPLDCVAAMLDSVGAKSDKVAAFDSIKAFMEINGVEPGDKLDEETTIQDKMYVASFECAKELIGKVASVNIKTLENGKALRALNAFLASNPLLPDEDEDSEYALFMKELQQKTEAHEAQLKLNRDRLVVRASFDDYVGGVDCTIDLNGNELITISTMAGRWYNFSVGTRSGSLNNVTLTIKNGTLSNTMGMGRSIMACAGSTLNFENMKLVANGRSVFIDDYGADLNFKDTIFEDHDTYGFIQIHSTPLNGYANCGCATCLKLYENNPSLVPYRNKYVFDNFHADSDVLYVRAQSHDTDDGLGRPVVEVHIKGNSSFIGDPLIIHKHAEGTRVKLVIEEGTRFDRQLNLPALSTDKIKVFSAVYVDKEGNEIENPVFGASGDPRFNYQVGSGYCTVTWHDLEGNVIGEPQEFVKGATPPALEYIANTNDATVGEDGIVYVSAHDYWSSEPNGEPVDIPPITEDVSYYSVAKRAPATVYALDAEGNPLIARLLPKISAQDVALLPSGATLYIAADASLSSSDNIRIPAGVTLSLGGNMLSLVTDDGSSASILLPTGTDGAATVENGIVYANGAPVVIDGGEGTLAFVDVEIKSVNSTAIRLSNGRVELHGGKLNVDSTSADVSGILLGESSGSVSIAFLGTRLNIHNVYNTAHAITVTSPRTGRTSVSVEFGAAEDGGALSGSVYGDMLHFAANPESATVKINVTDADLCAFGRLVGFEDEAALSVAPVSVTLLGSARIVAQSKGIRLFAAPGEEIVAPVDAPDTLMPLKANMKAYMSYAIWHSFTVNLYIPIESDIDLVTFADGVVFSAEATDALPIERVDGVLCYRVSCTDVAPSRALAAFRVSYITYVDGVGYSQSASFDLVDYARGIVEGDYVDEAKILAYDVLSYVKSAYEHFRKNLSAVELEKLALLESVLEDDAFDRVSPEYITELPTSEITAEDEGDLIESVQYRVGSGVALIVKLTDAGVGRDVSARLASNIELDAVAVDDRTVEFSISYAEINERVTVHVGESTVELDFAAYAALAIDEWADTNPALSDALIALYNLGVGAKRYEQRSESSDDSFIGDTPVVDAELKK